MQQKKSKKIMSDGLPSIIKLIPYAISSGGTTAWTTAYPA